MGYKAYSDSYLMSLTKPQIIELLRTAEHNFFATEEALNNSAKAGMEIVKKYDRAKELLKLAVDTFTRLEVNCLFFQSCDKCPIYNKEKDFCEWKYRKEALKLIGGEEDGN